MCTVNDKTYITDTAPNIFNFAKKRLTITRVTVHNKPYFHQVMFFMGTTYLTVQVPTH